jgi:hypothetical protein
LKERWFTTLPLDEHPERASEREEIEAALKPSLADEIDGRSVMIRNCAASQ